MKGYLELRSDGTLERAPKILEVPEVYRIPAAIDLFCSQGALKLQDLAAAGAAGGYGLLALEPQGAPEPLNLRSRSLQRHQQTGGAILLPLPWAMASDGSMADLGLMGRAGGSLFLVPRGDLSSQRLRQMFRYASAFPCRIAVVPNDGDLCLGGHINEGASSDRLGIKGLPSVAEVLGVQRSIALAGEWQVPLHLRCLSCRASLDAVAEGRRRGLDITCDVALANLLLDDSTYDAAHLDSALKPWPPLRSAEDRQALWDAVASGFVNAIVSGHRARHLDELALPFEEAPFGSEILAETIPTLMALWDRAGRPFAVERLLSCLSVGPRRVLGREVPGYTLIFRSERGWECRYEEE